MPGQDLPPNEYAQMIVSVGVLVALGVGLLAMGLRTLAQRTRRTSDLEPLPVGDQRRQSAAMSYSQREEAAAARIPVVDLTDLADGLNVMIIGPKNSGKTTTLNALLRLHEEYMLALDPHNEPGKWPVDVAGGGMQWGAVHARLLAAYETMVARYGAANRGERPQSSYQTPAWRFTLVGDEWGSITKELQGSRATRERPAVPGAGELLGKLIAQGRKAGVGVMVAAHDDTAAQLGLDGEMGLVNCFDYLIYLGAQAWQNSKVPPALREAARRMPRQAVVLDTNTGNWGLLTLDNLHRLRPASTARHAAPPDFAAAVRRIETEQDALLGSLLGGAGTAPLGAAPVQAGAGGASVVQAGAAVQVPGAELAEVSMLRRGALAAPAPVEAQPITVEELRMFAEAVRLIEAGESQTNAICKAFRVTKGSNARYQRARWLVQQGSAPAGADTDTASEEADEARQPVAA